MSRRCAWPISTVSNYVFVLRAPVRPHAETMPIAELERFDVLRGSVPNRMRVPMNEIVWASESVVRIIGAMTPVVKLAALETSCAMRSLAVAER